MVDVFQVPWENLDQRITNCHLVDPKIRRLDDKLVLWHHTPNSCTYPSGSRCCSSPFILQPPFVDDPPATCDRKWRTSFTTWQHVSRNSLRFEMSEVTERLQLPSTCAWSGPLETDYSAFIMHVLLHFLAFQGQIIKWIWWKLHLKTMNADPNVTGLSMFLVIKPLEICILYIV